MAREQEWLVKLTGDTSGIDGSIADAKKKINKENVTLKMDLEFSNIFKQLNENVDKINKILSNVSFDGSGVTKEFIDEFKNAIKEISNINIDMGSFSDSFAKEFAKITQMSKDTGIAIYNNINDKKWSKDVADEYEYLLRRYKNDQKFLANVKANAQADPSYLELGEKTVQQTKATLDNFLQSYKVKIPENYVEITNIKDAGNEVKNLSVDFSSLEQQLDKVNASLDVLRDKLSSIIMDDSFAKVEVIGFEKLAKEISEVTLAMKDLSLAFKSMSQYSNIISSRDYGDVASDLQNVTSKLNEYKNVIIETKSANDDLIKSTQEVLKRQSNEDRTKDQKTQVRNLNTINKSLLDYKKNIADVEAEITRLNGLMKTTKESMDKYKSAKQAVPYNQALTDYNDLLKQKKEQEKLLSTVTNDGIADKLGRSASQTYEMLKAYASAGGDLLEISSLSSGKWEHLLPVLKQLLLSTSDESNEIKEQVSTLELKEKQLKDELILAERKKQLLGEQNTEFKLQSEHINQIVNGLEKIATILAQIGNIDISSYVPKTTDSNTNVDGSNIDQDVDAVKAKLEQKLSEDVANLKVHIDMNISDVDKMLTDIETLVNSKQLKLNFDLTEFTSTIESLKDKLSKLKIAPISKETVSSLTEYDSSLSRLKESITSISHGLGNIADQTIDLYEGIHNTFSNDTNSIEQLIQSLSRLKSELSKDAGKSNFLETLNSWFKSDDAIMGMEDAKERFALVSKDMQNISNAFSTGENGRVKGKSIGAIIRQYEDEIGEVYDGFIHSHPKSEKSVPTAFSDADIKSYAALLSRGIKNQYVQAGNTLLHLDLTDDMITPQLIDKIAKSYGDKVKQIMQRVREESKNGILDVTKQENLLNEGLKSSLSENGLDPSIFKTYDISELTNKQNIEQSANMDKLFNDIKDDANKINSVSFEGFLTQFREFINTISSYSDTTLKIGIDLDQTKIQELINNLKQFIDRQSIKIDLTGNIDEQLARLNSSDIRQLKINVVTNIDELITELSAKLSTLNIDDTFVSKLENIVALLKTAMTELDFGLSKDVIDGEQLKLKAVLDINVEEWISQINEAIAKLPTVELKIKPDEDYINEQQKQNKAKTFNPNVPLSYFDNVTGDIVSMQKEVVNEFTRNNFTDVLISGIETLDGKIKKLSVTATDASTDIRKSFSFDAFSGENGEKYLVNTDQVKVSGVNSNNNAQMSKELYNSMFESLNKIYSIKTKMAGLDKSSKQYESLREELNLQRQLNDYAKRKVNRNTDLIDNEKNLKYLRKETELKAKLSTSRSKVSDSASKKKINERLQLQNDLYDEQKSLLSDINKIEKQLRGLESTNSNGDYTKLKEELALLQQQYKTNKTSIGRRRLKDQERELELEKQIAEYNREKYTWENKKSNSKTNSIATELGTYKNMISSVADASGKVDLYREKLLELSMVYNKLDAVLKGTAQANNGLFDDEILSAKEYESQIKNLVKTLKSPQWNTTNTKGGSLGTVLGIGNISTLEDANSKIKEIVSNLRVVGASDFKTSMGSWIGEIENVDGKIETVRLTWDQLIGDVRSSSMSLRSSLSGWDTFTTKLKNKMLEIGRYFISMGSAYQLINMVRSGVNIIKELDSAMTELNKVSNETMSTLLGFKSASYDIAISVGTTASQIINSAADFQRIGESLTEATESAKAANVLLNVSEFDSIDSATSSLIAMSQAYKDLDKMEIVDIMNNIGNNFSISTDGLAEGLQRSAASLVTAGNSIQEASALITAGNAITQDPESTGAGMRTIALRLMGTEEAKKQLEELGEETDNYTLSTSKLKDQIQGLTSVASNDFKGFSIVDDNGQLKSTFEIMTGIANVYQEIIETDKKNGNNNATSILEVLAGEQFLPECTVMYI